MAAVTPLPAPKPAEPRPEIREAIAGAARSSGVSFDYLVRQASLESGFDPAAKAATSSATGLYQFIDSTWLDMIRLHGAQHGLGEFAEAVRLEPRRDAAPGESAVVSRVADPELKRRILALRSDPRIAAAMAGEYARTNQQQLRGALGVEPGATELYLAHFLGPGGATRFLRARAADGGADAVAVAPQAAEANRAVFFDADGKPRSLDEVYRRFAAKFDAAVPPATRAVAAARERTPADTPAAQGATRELALKAIAGQRLTPLAIAVIAALDDEDNKSLAASFARLRAF